MLTSQCRQTKELAESSSFGNILQARSLNHRARINHQVSRESVTPTPQGAIVIAK